MKIFSFIGCCPNCKGNSARVVLTKKTEEGQIIRRRVCHNCGHRWYTLQYPEVVISGEEVYWPKGGRKCVYNPKQNAKT